MKKTLKRMLGIILVLALIWTNPALAHSGRTDSKGGHKDKKNKSGLGSYHYHCGGHPAHLHDGGICPYAPKDKISIHNAPSKMQVGDSTQLDYSVTAHSGSDRVNWESSDESVARVSASGELVAVGSGKATISAKLRNGEKTFNVTISNRAVERVRISAAPEEVAVGGVFGLSAEVVPENATDKRVRWTSEDEAVAVVMEDGTVVVIGEGETKITASAMDGGKAKDSVVVKASANDVEVDVASIRNQLPADYVFTVKPGSAAAEFVKMLGLAYVFAAPEDLPLHIGSRGETVREVQTALVAGGYLQDSADGIFGENTDAAVARFCEENAMEYHGLVDLERYIAIMESMV